MLVKTSRLLAPLAAVTAATLTLSACAANEMAPTGTASTSSTLSGTLNGVGSSAQATAQSAWTATFQKDHPDVTVNYDPQGSGAGRTAFLAGGVAFGASDAALSPDEIAEGSPICADGAAPIDLPVYISPIAIAYNLPTVEDLRLDAATVAHIFSGTITRWDDPAIAALNPDATLPDKRIVVVHRSDDSGTTENFTDYLAETVPEIWGKPASQTFPYVTGDAAKGTSGVANATRTAEGAITYIDASGATELQLAQLKVGDAYSTLSAEGAAAVVDQSPMIDGRADNDFAIDIERTVTSEGAWPLVLVSYLIVCEDYAEDATATLARAYATVIASEAGQAAAADVAGSAPLTGSLATSVRETIDSIS